jgi:hypothetical protein
MAKSSQTEQLDIEKLEDVLSRIVPKGTGQYEGHVRLVELYGGRDSAD